MDAESLKLAFDTASKWSELATVAVAAGVFIELVALFVFSKDMPPLEKKVMVFATLLIVGGCVGEYIFGSRANVAASQLQTAQDAAVATAKAEQERLKTLVNWRVIPNRNFNALISALSKVSGTVTLRYIATDAESLSLAVQISTAFKKANQSAGRKIWTFVADPHLYPNRLVFFLHIPDLKNESSRAVQKAFSDAKIGYQPDNIVEQDNFSIGFGGMTIGPTKLQTDALIIIGSKQPPF